MKSYFAGQCGAALGGIVGAAVAIGVKEARGPNPHSVFSREYQQHQDNENTIAAACITIGAAIGGLCGIIAVNK